MMSQETADMIIEELYESSLEFQFDFMEFLKKIHLPPKQLIFFMPTTEVITFKTNKHYEILSFKIYICELIFNAINLFPDILEYTIVIKDRNTSTMVIGYLDEIDSEGERCLAKITNKLGEYPLTKQNIHDLYIANRSKVVEEENIHTLLALMFLDSEYPRISTSYITKPSKTKY
jgi:hypothetical protein